jgi:hypothetical protein
MTEPPGGEAAAARSAEGDHDPRFRRPPALLVRMGGRWLCRHELTAPSANHDHAADVQLRP